MSTGFVGSHRFQQSTLALVNVGLEERHQGAREIQVFLRYFSVDGANLPFSCANPEEVEGQQFYRLLRWLMPISRV
jgi:hypothetical protein